MLRIVARFTTAAAFVVLAAAAVPAHAVVNLNSQNTNALNPNSLAPTGSQLGELNGVAVGAVTLPDEPAR